MRAVYRTGARAHGLSPVIDLNRLSLAADTLDRRVAAYLRRAHLPRSPWAPLVQVCMGLFGIGFAGGLLNHEYMDVRPLALVTFVIGTAVTIPALAMVMDGIWALARQPLRHYSPKWYARLVPPGVDDLSPLP